MISDPAHGEVTHHKLKLLAKYIQGITKFSSMNHSVLLLKNKSKKMTQLQATNLDSNLPNEY